jgi:hypothetical protein
MEQEFQANFRPMGAKLLIPAEGRSSRAARAPTEIFRERGNVPRAIFVKIRWRRGNVPRSIFHIFAFHVFTEHFEEMILFFCTVGMC